MTQLLAVDLTQFFFPNAMLLLSNNSCLSAADIFYMRIFNESNIMPSYRSVFLLNDYLMYIADKDNKDTPKYL